MEINLNQAFKNLEALIISQGQKKALTLMEVAAYTGLSKSHIYKLTSTGGIPCFKPHGKHLYFDREEIDNWLLQRRIKTAEEIEEEAATFLTLKNK